MAKRSDKKINILHLVETLGLGGAEMMIINYIRALGNDHYRHYVYCFGTGGPFRLRLDKLGIAVFMGPKYSSIKNPVKFLMSLLALAKSLRGFITNNGIQVIQSHAGHSNELAVVIGKLSRVPAFPTIHSTMAFADTRSALDPRVCLRKVLDRIIFRTTDKVIAVSEEIKEIIHQTYGVKESKILDVKNGIIFDECIAEAVDLAKEIPDSANKLKLIAVGRLVPLKGYDILIKAIADVVNQGRHDLLVLIAGDERGKGEERLRLDRLIKDLDLGHYIKMLGLRHDIIGLLKASDIFVMPSRYEGLSLAMIEAMACGLPIIASNGPGLRDNIDNQKNGLLFPVDDHKALAECILRLAGDNNLRNQLSCGARESFMNNYDMRKNIIPLASLIRGFVNGKRDLT
jgi:glycosyltransferase involved in cell wall biosynthesis